jgi:hypothetical protein
MDRGDDDTGGCFGNHGAPWEQVGNDRAVQIARLECMMLALWA